MQRRIGLTGGISTGKSTVADYLAHRYGLPVFDADQAARQAVTVGSPVWEQVRDRYANADHFALTDRPRISGIKLGHQDSEPGQDGANFHPCH